MSVITMGDRPVLLTGTTVAALADLVAALSGSAVEDETPPRKEAARTGGSPGQWVLHCAPGTVERPDRAPDRTVQHLTGWSEPDLEVVGTHPAGCDRSGAAQVRDGSAVLDPGAGGALAVHDLLFPVLSLLAAQQGLCLVHAAGVLTGDRAVLALGSSGAGKSTLVTAALAAGLPVLGDDLLLLRLTATGALEVAGVPQPVALPADLGHEVAVGPAIAGDHRRRHHAAAGVVLIGSWWPVGAVIQLEHGSGPTGGLRSATGRETLHRLRTSSLDGLTPGRAGRSFPFAAAAARLPGYHLAHATGPADRVRAAGAHLATIAAATL